MRPRAALARRLISVTGILIPKNSIRRHSNGFTLWEVLIVVIIISVSISVILLSSSLQRDAGDLKTLGSDISKLMQLLYQEAIFENRNFAITLTQSGYKVLEYDGQSWHESDQSLFRKIRLNAAQASTLVIDNLVIAAVGEAEMTPHILILSSGEMTPFEWTIKDNEARAAIVLQGDLPGKIRMTGPIPQS